MKRKLYIWVGLLFMPFLVLSFLFYFFSKPSGKPLSDEFKEKAIEKMLGREAVLTDTTPKGEKIYDGKNITFSYPAKAVVYEYREQSSSKDERGLDDFSFDIKSPKLVFNLKVMESRGAQTLSDIPAVKLRQNRSYEYKKENFTLDGIMGESYSKSENGGEKSGFVINNGKTITISITGSDFIEIERLFASIATSSKLK